MGRLYKTVKLDPHRPTKEEKVVKLTTFTGHAATARALAKQIGVGEKTIRRAEKFTDAVEMLREVSPQAVERVLRGEVRDALTELPKVPKEALAFVAKELEKGVRSIKRILMEWRQEQKEQQLKERAPLGRVGTHAGTGARTGACEF
jgi:hypothetical protein